MNQLEEMGVTLDDSNQTLTLTKAEMSAKGNYSCIVSNAQGSISRHLELDVQGMFDFMFCLFFVFIFYLFIFD